MKIGDKVMVYEDPYTQEKEEGAAVLVKHISSNDTDSMERWTVRFDMEPDGVYERFIAKAKGE